MGPARKRISLTLFTTLSLWGVLVFALLSSPPRNILSWDTFGYHLYLPATLIRHDPGLRDPVWVKEAVATYNSSGSLYQISKLADDDRWVMKYPMGLAMLWSPFFVGGHIAAGLVGAPKDGFSPPYQWALIIGSLLYMLIGLLVLRKVLSLFFTEHVTAAALALIVVGTNYFHQAIQGTGMPHVFLFTLGAGVLWHSLQWHRFHRLRDALLTGLLLGLLVVARPSEIVWVFVPLLIGLMEANSLGRHMRTLWSKRKHLLLMAATATLVCLPQLIYWKWMTGHWLYMSYNNPGEGFEFLHPYVGEVLFSFRKGWFIYTPLMLVATLGIFLVRRYIVEMRWPVVVFFVLNLYIVSSWSCWWYADSFGQRALVQSYPLMALPLAAVLCWLKEQRKRWVIMGVAPLLILVVFNLFQTHQSIHGLIHTSRMTWPAYKATFATMATPKDLSDLLLLDREQTTFAAAPDLEGYSATPLLMAVGRDTVELSWGRVTCADHVWIEARCDGSAEGDGMTLSAMMMHNGYAYHERTVVGQGDTATTIWYLGPLVRNVEDRLRIVRRGNARPNGRLLVTLHEPRTNRPIE